MPEIIDPIKFMEFGKGSTLNFRVLKRRYKSDSVPPYDIHFSKDGCMICEVKIEERSRTFTDAIGQLEI